MKFLNHTLLALLLISCAGTFSNTAIADAECKTDASLRINQHTAHVQLAVDERTRRYGLMFRASMGEHCGMLFVFDNTRTRVFTMRNTLIPLDIAFIDDAGRIGEILTMEPGGDRYPSTVKARYALEMNKGWFEANGIKVNDVIMVTDKSSGLKPLVSVSESKDNNG